MEIDRLQVRNQQDIPGADRTGCHQHLLHKPAINPNAVEAIETTAMMRGSVADFFIVVFKDWRGSSSAPVRTLKLMRLHTYGPEEVHPTDILSSREFRMRL